MTDRPFEDFSEKLDVKVDLDPPTLEELVSAVSSGLKKNFDDVVVEVASCPDLREEPFRMSAPGFGGTLRVADVGGQCNLFPHVQRHKEFNLKAICSVCEADNAFVFGPGAGPRAEVGANSEMVADAWFDGTQQVNTRIAKIAGSSFEQTTTTSPYFNLMANLAISDGFPGHQTLRVRAKKRRGPLNFPESIRQALSEQFGTRLVSMAGVFVIEKGLAKVHVMPELPDGDFESRQHFEKEWLRYFEVPAPLVCASVFHSMDPGLSLRIEHTHCYNNGGGVGHYHYDVSPDDVEYTGYFRPADVLYRIDKV
ncbi:Protein C24B5.4 [Aphelenchoides avenae]|nr:Protein C24B5.4 [Aphelenchus avenae]